MNDKEPYYITGGAGVHLYSTKGTCLGVHLYSIKGTWFGIPARMGPQSQPRTVATTVQPSEHDLTTKRASSCWRQLRCVQFLRSRDAGDRPWYLPNHSLGFATSLPSFHVLAAWVEGWRGAGGRRGTVREKKDQRLAAHHTPGLGP